MNKAETLWLSAHNVLVSEVQSVSRRIDASLATTWAVPASADNLDRLFAAVEHADKVFCKFRGAMPPPIWRSVLTMWERFGLLCADTSYRVRQRRAPGGGAGGGGGGGSGGVDVRGGGGGGGASPAEEAFLATDAALQLFLRSLDQKHTTAVTKVSSYLADLRVAAASAAASSSASAAANTTDSARGGGGGGGGDIFRSPAERDAMRAEIHKFLYKDAYDAYDRHIQQQASNSSSSSIAAAAASDAAVAPPPPPFRPTLRSLPLPPCAEIRGGGQLAPTVRVVNACLRTWLSAPGGHAALAPARRDALRVLAALAADKDPYLG